MESVLPKLLSAPPNCFRGGNTQAIIHSLRENLFLFFVEINGPIRVLINILSFPFFEKIFVDEAHHIECPSIYYENEEDYLEDSKNNIMDSESINTEDILYDDESIKNFFMNNKTSDDKDIKMWVLSECNSFHVLDNINKKKNDKIIGHDSIGCTIYCGKQKVDRIFWCGSILSDTDKNVDANFTPTIIQVAAGLLSGLSYIMEDKNKNRGLLEPCDLDTTYILQKSIPLLGKFFFTEIPKELFIGKLEYEFV